jgi:tetratricopeptide (TPR) repeat protein
MTTNLESKSLALLQAIRPWFPQEDAYLVDLARYDMNARLLVGIALVGSEEQEEAETLFDSIIQFEATGEGEDWTHVKRRACLELAQLKMDQLKYDEAEDVLWKARNELIPAVKDDISKEDISLLIAQCRFGQGFIQEAIDRAEEVLRKQNSDQADDVKLARTYQQLGWFHLHKMDVPLALQHMKQAMRLAPALDRELVDEAIVAEQTGDFEKAIGHYFDSIQFDIE